MGVNQHQDAAQGEIINNIYNTFNSLIIAATPQEQAGLNQALIRELDSRRTEAARKDAEARATATEQPLLTTPPKLATPLLTLGVRAILKKFGCCNNPS